MKKVFTLLLYASVCMSTVVAQEQAITREQVMAMSIDELSELSLEQLMAAVEVLGVSSVDELFALIMNKNVSSASKTEESSFTSPLSSTVITHEELRTYGCTTIEEAFRLIPGMIVSQKTNGVYDVHLRGLNNIPDNNMLNYTENANCLLMVDGRVLHNYGLGITNVEMLPISIEDVEHIEVIRGANSALYGVNAVNGVINIITRKPDACTDNISGSIQMGSLNTVVADIAYRKALCRSVALGLSLNTQYRERPTDKLCVAGSDYYVDNKNVLSTGFATMYAPEQIEALCQKGDIYHVADGEFVSPDDFNNMKQLATSAVMPSFVNMFRSVPVEYANVRQVFRRPGLARKNVGLNGYLTITPDAAVRIDVSGGYSQNFVTSTTLVDSPYSFNPRKADKAYVNVEAAIHGLHLLANYSNGPEDYVTGRPGFNVHTQQAMASAEYNINIGGGQSAWGTMSLRPGVSYMYLYTHDILAEYDYGDGRGPQRMAGFFGEESKGEAYMWFVAPSLRADYRKDDFRAILSLRADKTNMPDKWNPAWQAVLSYGINGQNFVRASYSRGRRSANLLATSADYVWLRGGMNYPSEVKYLGNKEAELMRIDNFEVGYRLKPTDALLVDAEAYYSRSTDYGSMTAYRSEVYVPDATLVYMGKYIDQNIDFTSPEAIPILGGGVLTAMADGMVGARTYIRHQVQPYVVNQMGVGVNLDWIISPKLVAKVNANVQRTWIDNYYAYEQDYNVGYQIMSCIQRMQYSLPDALGTLLGYDFDVASKTFVKYNSPRSLDEVAYAMLQNVPTDEAYAAMMALPEDQRAAAVDALRAEWLAGNDHVTINGYEPYNPIATYYGLKHQIRRTDDTTVMASGDSLPVEYEDNHRHKATPAVYGMLGLIYKPINKICVSAYGNFMSKRSYLVCYGEKELDPRFTLNLKVGYKPTTNCEIFFNANNLFNTKQREFVYSDEIGGLYTIGINFGF